MRGLRTEDNVNLIIEILSKFELVVSHPSLRLAVTFCKFVISSGFLPNSSPHTYVDDKNPPVPVRSEQVNINGFPIKKYLHLVW